MSDFNYKCEVVHVSRDAGYNKLKSISPECRRRCRKRMNDPNVLAGNYGLKEIFAKIGITVHPEKMTNWYNHQE